MTYDVSSIGEFDEAVYIDDYWGLMKFFSKYDREYFVSRSVYVENHHVYPKFEAGLYLPFTVCLPIYFHFKAHLLRARESLDEETKLMNYSCAFMTVNGSSRRYSRDGVKFVFEKFPSEIQEAREAHAALASRAFTARNGSLAGKTYDEIYGKEKADAVKAKLSVSTTVKNLNEDEATRSKRAASIKRYASNRPATHNEAISRSKTGKPSRKPTKPVVHLNTMTVYHSVIEASRATGQKYNSIRVVCKDPSKRVQSNGHFWSFYEEGVDYDALYEDLKKKKADRPKGWASFKRS